MKRLALLAALAALLAACSTEELETAGFAAAKGWCRNTPQACAVHEPPP